MFRTISFFFQNKLFYRKITSAHLRSILKRLGFDVVEYTLAEGDAAAQFLKEAGLLTAAQSYPCFTAGNRHVVFIRSGHSERDQIILLLHEAAHIWLEHFHEADIVHRTSTLRELQANVFSITVFFLSAMFRQMLPIAACIGIGFLIFNLTSKPDDVEVFVIQETVAEEITESTTIPDIVYYTERGEVYHIYEDCRHLKNSTVYSGSVEDSEKSRCCNTCLERNKKDLNN